MSICANWFGHNVQLPLAGKTELPVEGTSIRRVLNAARSLPGKFNAHDIIKLLVGDGHDFRGRDPIIAVNQSLRNLTKADFIRIVRAGSGRIPHIYEAVKGDIVRN